MIVGFAGGFLTICCCCCGGGGGGWVAGLCKWFVHTVIDLASKSLKQDT
jgi:hypothetical protein